MSFAGARSIGSAALLVLVAAPLACAFTARSASKAGTEGTVEALREIDDEVLRGFHEDLKRDPTIPGLGRRLTDGVIQSIGHALPSPEAVLERVATGLKKRLDAIDPAAIAAAADRLVRALARDARTELGAALGPVADSVRESVRTLPVREIAGEIGAAFGRGMAEEISRSLGRELAKAVEAASRATSASGSAAVLAQVGDAAEQIATRVTRGTWKEIQAQVEADRRWSQAGWIALGAGGAVLVALGLLARAYRRFRLAEEAIFVLRGEIEAHGERTGDWAIKRRVEERAGQQPRGAALREFLRERGVVEDETGRPGGNKPGGT